MRLMIYSSPSLSSSVLIITKANNCLSSSSSSSSSLIFLRSIFSSSPSLCCNYSSPPAEEEEEPQTLNSSSPPPTAAETPTFSILNPINPRTRTPLEKQFETWVDKLKPGFTPLDVDDALRSQSDPDLALDIFRWTAQRRGYKHNHITYHTMIQISISGKRLGHTETLIDEVVAGACSGSLPLYNSIIRYCCTRRPLFNRAFDVYKKMLKSSSSSSSSPHCKPSLETYTMLLNAVLRKFNKLNICYVYLHAVRSLLKQMKASGVIPDTYALNLIIKAYSKCLEMDGAIRVFREMGLYGCEPNSFSYSYIAKGLCEKGRVTQGFDFYKEMRERGLIPTSTTYMILICSLSLERRFEEATEIMFDMLANSMVPDVLTYRTLLEGLCREGKGDEAFELLEELRKKQGSMGDKTYKNLLEELHFLSQE